MRTLVLVLVLASLSTACVGSVLRSNEAPPEQYRLEAPAAVPGGPVVQLAIAVARPRAPSSLDTDRIAVTTPGNGFDYLAGARWADPAPQMLQQLLVVTLAGDGHFATAIAAPSRVSPDLLLDVELRRFEAAYAQADAPPTVVVEFEANLVDARKGMRMLSFRSTASVPASSNDRAAVVAAFEQAAGQAVRDAATRVAAAATTTH